ncbi:Transcription factor [Penicillium occitanis (nom. inval.)]|nr:hypothetical protein PENOC_078540 [Penicillium occitanis (nom. inval.)]PCH04951.1 Transcription factor [Penicillium occitanis (nom. inval.)]
MPEKRKFCNVEESIDDSKKRTPRQDPVSCQSCRKKKLKCDRQQPCSNCRSRRILCNYAVANAAQYAHPPVALPDTPLSTQNNITTSQPHVHRTQEATEQERTTDWLENIMMAPRIPDALPMSIKNKLVTTKHSAMSVTNLTSFLPRETEALAQFNYYVDYVGYLYHTIIPNHVECQIHAIYQSMHDASSAAVNLNHLALLFSILASAYYFQNLGTNAAPAKQVEKRCHEYITLITAALTQSDYMNYPTVEGLQASLVVIQFLPNHEQDTPARALFHMGTLVNQCRQMGLFQIDSAQNKAFRKTHRFDPADVELRRRLAWLVASSDWFLAYLGGPQEGSYLVNPAHMALDIPANIPDENLCTLENGGGSLPDNVPTTMSYFIFRLKLSFYCRDIVDYTCRERLEGVDVPYNKIMELDQKWHEYNKQLPEFFRLDNISRRKYAQVYANSPQIAWQRLLVQQGSHSRLCRLHRTYFIRGARDPAYSYSHMICLQAARRVIEIKRIMDKEFPDTPSVTTAWSVMHHVFMAAVILLMDTCFNWDDILADRRKEEILEACRMLDRARRASRLVREGINAMMDILQSRWRPISSDQLSSSQQEEHPAQHQEDTDFHSTREAERTGAQRRIEDVSASTALYPSTDADNNASFAIDATEDACDLENMWSEFLDSGAMMTGSPNEWMGLLSDLTESAPVL